MTTLTITPTTLNLNDIENDTASTSSINLAADGGNVNNITATSSDSQLLLKVLTEDSSYSSSKTFSINDGQTKTLGFQLTPTTEGDNLSLTFTVVHAGTSTNQTITVNYSSYENLETFGVIRVNKIIARDGIFSGNTIDMGGVKIGASNEGKFSVQASQDTEASSFAKNFQIDDGFAIPRNYVKVNKNTDEVTIKTKNNEVVKVDSNGVVLVEKGVVLATNVDSVSDDDWKLDRDSGDNSTALYKRVSGAWVKRVAFT